MGWPDGYAELAQAQRAHVCEVHDGGDARFTRCLQDGIAVRLRRNDRDGHCFEHGCHASERIPCSAIVSSVNVGVTIGRGWREAINSRMGSVRGCTHMWEMLFNLATAAFQTFPFYRSQIASKEASGETRKARRPLQVGQCVTWDPEGPFMQRLQQLEAQ